MKLIVCVDDKNGMMFGKRRQSQDRLLRERILALIGQSTLWVSEYTARQFAEVDRITVDNAYADKAGDNDYCFIEDGEMPIDRCDTLVLYRWNRRYQADRFFNVDLKEAGYTRISQSHFEGHSHPKITEEIYSK